MNSLGNIVKSVKYVFDSFQDGICIFDITGNIVYTNTSWGDIVSFLRNISHDNFFLCCKRIDSNSFNGIEGKVSALFDGRIGSYEVKYTIPSFNNNIRHILMTLTPFFDRGKVIGVISTHRDISNYFNFQNELRRQKALFSSIYNNSSSADVISNPNNEIVMVNLKTEEFFGYSSEELLGLTLKKLECNDDHELIGNSDTKSTIKCYKRKDGSTFYGEVSETTLVDNDQNCLGKLTQIKDITEKQFYEKALLKKNRILSQSEKIANFGTWNFDVLSKELSWSEGMFEIHGMDPKEEPQPSFEDALQFFIPSERNKVTLHFFNILTDKKDFQFISRIRTKNKQTRWVKSYGTCHVNDDGVVDSIFGVYQDITDIKRAEEALKYRLEDLVDRKTVELKKAQSELLKQEKLAIIGKLLAIVAHELRNPLGTIRNSLYVIQQRIDDQYITDNIIDDSVERVSRNITRCDNIVEGLMTYVRSTKPELKKTNLYDLVQSVLSDLDYSNNIRIDNDTDRDLELYIDPLRFHRVLVNLINNSIEAILDQDFGRGYGNIRIYNKITNNSVEIYVYDNGPGIHPNDLKMVMEPLVSTKSFGVGLGLAVVKQILEDHKGSIDISSVHGEHTCVKLVLSSSTVIK